MTEENRPLELGYVFKDGALNWKVGCTWPGCVMLLGSVVMLVVLFFLMLGLLLN